MVVNQCPGIVVDSWGSPNLPGVEAAVALLLLSRGRVCVSHGLGLVIALGLGWGLGRIVGAALIATTMGEEEAVSQSVPS